MLCCASLQTLPQLIGSDMMHFVCTKWASRQPIFSKELLNFLPEHPFRFFELEVIPHCPYAVFRVQNLEDMSHVIASQCSVNISGDLGSAHYQVLLMSESNKRLMRHLQTHGIPNKCPAEDPNGSVGSAQHIQKVIHTESARDVVPALQLQCIMVLLQFRTYRLEHPASVNYIVEGIDHKSVMIIELDIMRPCT